MRYRKTLGILLAGIILSGNTMIPAGAEEADEAVIFAEETVDTEETVVAEENDAEVIDANEKDEEIIAADESIDDKAMLQEDFFGDENTDLVIESVESVETIPFLADEKEAGLSLTDVLPDGETLFAGYCMDLFYGHDRVLFYGSFAGDRLEGMEKVMYDQLKAGISMTASGDHPFASYEITGDSLQELRYVTAEELGVEAVTSEGKESEEASAALAKRLGEASNRVILSLLEDCPFELYWYDKEEEIEFFYTPVADGVNNRYELRNAGWIFPVSAKYQDKNSNQPKNTVDGTATTAARNAADNAASIVEENKNKTDYDKLKAYCQAVCDLVSYNTAAASGEDTVYGDPWQLIWVFDGDPSTNVVCEGYAKAFQYLCDLTEFRNEEIVCFGVSGRMTGGIGAGEHMWNIVTMEDGRNYLVDVTNCDSGSVGAPDLLFLVGNPQGSAASGYIFTLDNGQQVGYYYDEDQSELSGSENLTLAKNSIHGSDRAEFIWQEDGSGCVLRINCPDCGRYQEKECKISINTTEPTCTEYGYRNCTALAYGAESGKTVSLAPLGHIPGNPTEENRSNTTWEEVIRCTRCGVELSRERKNSGETPTGSGQLSVSSLLLKTGQKTKVLKVTGMVAGDQVTSWISDDTSIVKVSGRPDGTSTVTAGRKTGKTAITVRLASGTVLKVSVKIQKKTVTTKAISLKPGKVTLKKGQKLKLKVALDPLTSQEKIRYTSSAKQIAKVTAGGTVTAVRPGKAKITVSSGKKKARVKVTVK